MTSPVSEFRDIVHLLFRVVHPNSYNNPELHTLLDKIHDVLIRETPPFIPPFEIMRPHEPPTLVIHSDQEAGEVVPNVVVTKEDAEEQSVRNVVVNLRPSAVHMVKTDMSPIDKAILKNLAYSNNLVGTPKVNNVHSTPDLAESDSEDSVGDCTNVEEVKRVEDKEGEESEGEESEVEDEDEESEDEEDDDDDLELLKIKKQKYYYSPSSKRIYEHLEEGYGDCIGTYVDGKIIAKE